MTAEHRQGKIRIGTSGWSFDSWRKVFYPAGTRDFLGFFATQFNTVELNNSFYHLPDRHTVTAWADTVPASFRFSVKASRYLTHMKKLKEPEEALERLLAAVAPFGKRLGPILFQLPPYWHVDPDRLQSLLVQLPRDQRFAFEFRDRSWLCREVYALLRQYAAALCIYDFAGFRSPRSLTADFAYVRLHGPHKTAYEGSYDGRTLAGWAKLFRRWADEGHDVYCYLDNDRKACAPADAKQLQKSLRRLD